MNVIAKILSFLPALIKGFKLFKIGWECIILKKSGKPNTDKHNELKNYINEYLTPLNLDITDKQLDAFIEVIVEIIK
jgi:hypothetical protein